MRVRMISSAPGDPVSGQYLTTFLLDDVVAIDAGSLGFRGSPAEQARVGHIFLTHSHADHVASLPLFVESVHASGAPPVVVRGHADTLRCLRTDVFNDRIWPDYIRLEAEGPFLRLEEVRAEETVEVGGLRVTPVPVDHVVPALGYVVDDGTAAVVFGGDGGPTGRLWEIARRHDRLRAVFLETTFPDEQSELARLTKHLTPRLLAGELRKLDRDVRVLVMHLKAGHRDAVARQIEALDDPRIALVELDREYVF